MIVTMDVDPAELVSVLGIRDAVYAQDLILAAVARLDLLTVMSEEPGTLEALCSHHDIAYRSGDVLCTLLRATGLLEAGEILRPTALALSCLVAGAPHDLRPQLSSAASRPTCVAVAELLRTGALPAAGPWLNRHPGDHWEPVATCPISNLSGVRLAERLADVKYSAVLEIGAGGVGGRALARGRRGVRVAALGPELTMLPYGHDLHLFGHVLHRWNATDVRKALTLSFDALVPGGWVVDHDTHLNADKTGPLSVAQYSAALLSTTDGQCWSVSEVANFLGEAGFVNIEERHTGADRTAIIAQKPVIPGLD